MDANKLFFSTDNISYVVAIISDLFNKEYGVSAEKQTIVDTLRIVMKRVFKDHPKPRHINLKEYIKDINTISISESIKTIRSQLKNNSIDNVNMSIIPSAYGMQPGMMQPGMMQPGMMQPGMMPGQQSRLPFNQVNPGNEMRGNSDSLLQQRINERNGLDVAHGGKPMHQAPGMMQPGMMPAAGGVNMHPAIIHKFLSMGPEGQQRLAIANPQYYQQIVNTINRQQMMQQQQQQPQQQPADDQASTLSSSSISTPGSESDASTDLCNNHSSEENSEGELNGEYKKTKSKKTKKNKKKPKSRTKALLKERERTLKAAESRSIQVKHRRKKPDQNVRTSHDSLYLSLDFRNDMLETDNDTYVLGFPAQHNVNSIELESCLISRNAVLEREPYIYIAIDEIPGDYKITTGHKANNVFGKLIQEKTVNEFMVYKPENCVKVFTEPNRINKLTISFLKYDLTPVQLNKLDVKKLRKAQDYLKITTKTPHYLTVGDRVNICCSQEDHVTIDMVEVLDVVSKDYIAIDIPIYSITHGANLQFEKVDLKCTMTFKVTC